MEFLWSRIKFGNTLGASPSSTVLVVVKQNARYQGFLNIKHIVYT